VNLNCSQLEKMAHTIPLIRGCDVVRNGALRMSTPFLYPNGDRIDVFLEVKQGDLFTPLSLSDYGHTALYLRDAQVKIEANDRKTDVLGSILTQLNVNYSNGDLSIDIQEAQPTDLSDAIFRLSQACLRISDFAAHTRLRTVNPFRDDIAGFLGSTGLKCVPDVQVRGSYQNQVKIDFQVFGKQQSSYLCVLAPTETAVHTSANEVFRKFYDIRTVNDDYQRVAIYSSASRLKDSDKKRLRDYSTVVAYPSEQRVLTDLIAA
jgi:hypothetical protein